MFHKFHQSTKVIILLCLPSLVTLVISLFYRTEIKREQKWPELIEWMDVQFFIGAVGISILIMFSGMLYQHTQDIKRKKAWSIVVQYYPPDWITPTIAWYLENDQFNSSDFAALIYDRWARGLIKIESRDSWEFYVSDSVILIKTQETINLNSHEEKIRTTIFWENNEFNIDIMRYGWTNQKRTIFFNLIIKYIEISIEWFYKYSHELTIQQKAASLLGNKFYNELGNKIYSQIIGYRNFLQDVDLILLQEYYNKDPLIIDAMIPRAISFWTTNSLFPKLKKISPQYNPKRNMYFTNNPTKIIQNSINVIDRSYNEYKNPKQWV